MSCLQYKNRSVQCRGTCYDGVLKVNSKIFSGYKNKNIDVNTKLRDGLCSMYAKCGSGHLLNSQYNYYSSTNHICIY